MQVTLEGMVGDAWSGSLVIFKSHDLHAGDIRGDVREIVS
jgi:hypothetical protein